MDLTFRMQFLQVIMFSGGFYATWWMIITIFYPAASAILFRKIIGPVIIKISPSLVQSRDESLPSYLPSQHEQPCVLVAHTPLPFSFVPPSINAVANAFSTGMIVAVLAILVPEGLNSPVSPVLVFPVMFLIGPSIWRASKQKGSAKTDQVMLDAKQVFLFGGIIALLHHVFGFWV